MPSLPCSSKWPVSRVEAYLEQPLFAVLIGALKRTGDAAPEKKCRIIMEESWLLASERVWMTSRGVSRRDGFITGMLRNHPLIPYQAVLSNYRDNLNSLDPARSPSSPTSVKMGWLWKSPPKDEPRQDDLQQPQPPAASNAPQPPQTMTREEKADAELSQFLAMLNAEESRNSPSSPSSSSTEPNPSSQQPPRPTLSPESLYPDSMSCRDAFDYAFFCQSFGGQFVNWYRYGELRSCSEHWDNFWTCMRTRTRPDDERKRVIRDHYRRKVAKYKSGPSSEDVWDLRMEPARNAFQGDFHALEKEMESAGGSATGAAGGATN